MSANTDEEFDRLIKKFGEGYGLTSIERGLIINGILKLKQAKQWVLCLCDRIEEQWPIDCDAKRCAIEARAYLSRFEPRTPGTSEVGGCDGSACVECATPCEHHLERLR